MQFATVEDAIRWVVTNQVFYPGTFDHSFTNSIYHLRVQQRLALSEKQANTILRIFRTMTKKTPTRFPWLQDASWVNLLANPTYEIMPVPSTSQKPEARLIGPNVIVFCHFFSEYLNDDLKRLRAYFSGDSYLSDNPSSYFKEHRVYLLRINKRNAMMVDAMLREYKINPDEETAELIKGLMTNTAENEIDVSASDDTLHVQVTGQDYFDYMHFIQDTEELL